jgi:hypothetical protein
LKINDLRKVRLDRRRSGFGPRPSSFLSHRSRAKGNEQRSLEHIVSGHYGARRVLQGSPSAAMPDELEFHINHRPDLRVWRVTCRDFPRGLRFAAENSRSTRIRRPSA